MVGAIVLPAAAQIDVAMNALAMQPNVPVLIRLRTIDGIVAKGSHIIFGAAFATMRPLPRDLAARSRAEVSPPKVPCGIAAIKFAGFEAGA